MKTVLITICLSLFLGIVQGQTLRDIFGRDLKDKNIVLVDWEGYMANPAIRLTLEPPKNASFPLNINISANHSRLYFNMPSLTGASGPSKTITFQNSSPVDFFISIFPDRAGGDENYTLTVGNKEFNILVIDQDITNPNTSNDLKIFIDYTYDKSYNFYRDVARKNVLRQAADDWSYFIQNNNFDEVAAQQELTYIWKDDFKGGQWQPNKSAYKGFLLYSYGFHCEIHRSGGAPSTHAFQSIGGVKTKLRRSGSIEAETHGNYNTLGWNTQIDDDTWYKAVNLRDTQPDFYSIAIHEMGHALAFNGGYPVFQGYKDLGYINDKEVVAYYGDNITVENTDHLSEGDTKFVDRISKKGVFGSEYATFMPFGRWQITKLHLLILKAVGYNIKETSAFKPVQLKINTLPTGRSGEIYSANISAEGGIPFYNFEVSSGKLPEGLTMDSFTGKIAGIPTQRGTFNLTIRVTDYDNKTNSKKLVLKVI